MTGPAEKKEPWLYDRQTTVKLLQKYGIRLQKRFGQNFLVDPHVLKKIIAAAGIGPEDHVLEIGPGIGTLTQQLSYYAKDVTAVEIDKSLEEIHKETLEGFTNVHVVWNDIMKVDVRELMKERGADRFKVVANLPYYITTPIIMYFLENGLPVESLTVMVQKEVAQRMNARPGTKEYGALSLAVQYYADTYLAANVPVNCFCPRPDVDSAVIRLTIKPEKIAVKDPSFMFDLIRAGFSKRRKTLMNCLRSAESISPGREEILAAFERLGFAEDVRGESLGLEQFAALADELKK